MTGVITTRARRVAGAAALALVAGGIGFAAARWSAARISAPAKPERKIVYWYDPMIPAEHHDGPGLSSMGMKMIPKYGESGPGQPASTGVAIDAARVQQLGARIVTAARGALASSAAATGTIEFDERDVAVIQARGAGFVQRVYARAPGDIVGAGAPLADILTPEWAGAQAEFLAVRRSGDPALTRAARARLLLLGMSSGLVTAIERSGRTHGVVTVGTPIAGTLKTLSVRQGMTVTQGETLAEVNGLGTVWLNAAVPEAAAGGLHVGTRVTATLAAFPGESFTGLIAAVLPQADVASRTLTVRIELPNKGKRLRPGMFANVALEQGRRDALLVPSEAVIRTGRRTLVMLAQPGGRFRPAEVRLGAEAAGQSEILAGLVAGERVVASGQFLIDSEASLAGIQPRPVDAASTQDTAR